MKRQQSSEYLGLLYHKRGNPPSFGGGFFSLVQFGRGFCELANYEYDYLGRALDGTPDLSRRGVTLHPFPPSHQVLTWRPGTAPRNRISRIIGPPSIAKVDDKYYNSSTIDLTYRENQLKCYIDQDLKLDIISLSSDFDAIESRNHFCLSKKMK